MDAPEAAPRRESLSPAFVAARRTAAPVARPALVAIAWAAAASTLRRLQRGEGALLAVNLSLIAYHTPWRPHALAAALVSLLAIVVMYALNDLHDAPTDSNNPKKDPALIGVYLAHPRACLALIVVAKAALLTLAWTTLGPRATAALAGTLGANLAYSVALKGMPVVDVVWCGIWGALYAAIVTARADLCLLVGLMTAVCHLYQALDDRDADAANAITTTAVRSPGLSTAVLAAACTSLAAAVVAPLGVPWAATALLPVGIHLTGLPARTGWLLTKAYFGVLWLAVLGLARAAG